MAAPSAPTLTTITTEGIKKAGYSSPSAGQLTRAETWVEEIKNDIFTRAKKLKFLQENAVTIMVNGKSRYALPTDFSSILSVNFLFGTHSDTAQAGSASSLTLSAAEDIGDSIIGRMLLITTGAAAGSMSQCTAYDEATKIATVEPDFINTPGADNYMIIDSETPLQEEPIQNFDNLNLAHVQGTPSHYAIIGNSSDGEIIVYPVPFRNDGEVYGLQVRYYVDLAELDLNSTLMSTLYKRWRNLFIQGVYAQQLSDDDDNRAQTEYSKYLGKLNELVARETYGMDISNLSMEVRDY